MLHVQPMASLELSPMTCVARYGQMPWIAVRKSAALLVFETCIVLLSGKEKLLEVVVYDHELMPPA